MDNLTMSLTRVRMTGVAAAACAANSRTRAANGEHSTEPIGSGGNNLPRDVVNRLTNLSSDVGNDHTEIEIAVWLGRTRA